MGGPETKILFYVLLAEKLFSLRDNGWFLHSPGSVSWSGS